MKIAYTHPFAWPMVRRGNERNIDVMSRHFASHGHEVTSISSHPGARVVEHDEGVTRILARSIELPGMSRLRIANTHTFFLAAWKELRRLDLDVVHSLLFTDALAATTLAPRQGFSTVFQMNGVAIPGLSCRRFPPEAAMYRRVMRSADALVTCSEFIRSLVLEHYGADSYVIPPMVDVAAFDTGDTYSVERPNLLAAGDFTVPRKGIRVLLEAFPLVKREIPDLVLNLSGRMPEKQITEYMLAMPENVRRDIRLLGLGQPEDLPRIYAEASALVLPSMGEPSGTVLMEAWSAGTPIVTTNHGGVPEFVTEEVGVLFEPKTDEDETRNAKGLAKAIFDVLQLAQQPGTTAACREHAGSFSAARTGEKIEALYKQIIR
jgi:glycogen(starch) synthase